MDVAVRCFFVAQSALLALYVIGGARGISRRLLVRVIAPRACCAYTALAVLALIRGRQMSGGVYGFLVVWWAVDWWRNGLRDAARLENRGGACSP
ncbi:hypothetical protein [Frankia sp. KB5]|uniref:hypothetical protein n=1 Tax=Frankia sp. KB5 TaxID=683318 RepID=UPI0010562E69|nr:hypothetical protein [Frankia sp. KB5]